MCGARLPDPLTLRAQWCWCVSRIPKLPGTSWASSAREKAQIWGLQEWGRARTVTRSR